MEECKELFAHLASASFEKELKKISHSLTKKQIKIKESTTIILPHEAKEMIDLLERKRICLQSWLKLCKRTDQPEHQNMHK